LKLNILQISASYKPAYIYGGPTMSVSQLAENLVACGGHKVSVYTTTANGVTELAVIPNTTHLINGVQVTYFKRLTKDHSHFSPRLYMALWQNISQFDVIHLHAWWHLVSVFSALICILKNKKFIVSPRGTLSNYSFNNKTTFLKKTFHSLIGKPILLKANFLLTSKKEQDDLIALLKTPKTTFVLPNFVKTATNNTDSQMPNLACFKLLFLSRIEEKKGVEFLFAALQNLPLNYQLTIAGTGETSYIKQLKKLAIKLNIQNNIHWLGQVGTDDKFEVLNQHHLLVLPSYDENFANVVIESLSVGTAVLITPEVGLSDFVVSHHLGWLCTQNAEDIKSKIEYVFTQKEKLEKIKKNAPVFISSQFDKENLTKKYLNYYATTLYNLNSAADPRKGSKKVNKSMI
jgi:glycosyltransferase involved in cell wall biosynthesis